MSGWNEASRWIGRFVAASVVLVGLAWAQGIGPDEVKISSRPYPQNQTVFRVTTELVEIGVVPRDTHGRAVPGFKQEDFEIYDEGKLRPIKAFSIASAQPASAPSPSPGTLPAASSADKPASSQQKGAAADIVPSRSIALFFDDIHSNVGDLGRAKIAAKRFLEHGLAPGDRIALFTSTGTVFVDYTQDSTKLLAAMSQLQAHPRVPENGIVQCPRITPYQAYLIANDLDPTALQAAETEAASCETTGIARSPFTGKAPSPDSPGGGGVGGQSPGLQINGPEMAAASVIRAQAEQTWNMTKVATHATLDAVERTLDSLAKQPEQRLLLLVSSGFLLEVDNAEQDLVIAQALRSKTVISSLDAKGVYAEAPFLPFDATPNSFNMNSMKALIFGSVTLGAKLDDLGRTMANFSRSTGGLIFRNNNDLDLGFREIGMTPEITYLLSIEPAHDGKYHHLRLKVRGADNDLVQARPGYFAPAQNTAQAASPQNAIDKGVASTEQAAGLPVTISAQQGPLQDGSPAVWVTVHFDVSTMKFASDPGRHSQNLRLVAALLDGKGHIVAGKESAMQLALKDGSFAQLLKSGITAKTFLQAPPGQYRLREVIQDAEGRLFASTVPVEVR
ncbi:MAG TPA: VWA domain-containing protein [Candidatus Acidoferrum sp.]|nr:VWA domain-containing protein [Candidatus Acidoferrum sp.]